MKDIIVKIILLAICISLIVGVVIPIAQQVRDTGQNTFNVVKNLNSNISP